MKLESTIHRMKTSTLFLLFLSMKLFAAEFPHVPHPELTPGELCQSPAKKRYAERINYCRRDVSRELKQSVFQEYRKLGFNLPESQRHKYKIDHMIPLCAGGSNGRENLWPQHESIYLKTDPIEHLGCEKLAQNKIRQKPLLDLIQRAKLHPETAAAVLKEIESL